MATKDKRWGESRSQLWKTPDNNKFWHLWKEKGKEGLGGKIWQSTVRESSDRNSGLSEL